MEDRLSIGRRHQYICLSFFFLKVKPPLFESLFALLPALITFAVRLSELDFAIDEPFIDLRIRGHHPTLFGFLVDVAIFCHMSL
jgi:hypothetical protein